MPRETIDAHSFILFSRNITSPFENHFRRHIAKPMMTCKGLSVSETIIWYWLIPSLSSHVTGSVWNMSLCKVCSRAMYTIFTISAMHCNKRQTQQALTCSCPFESRPWPLLSTALVGTCGENYSQPILWGKYDVSCEWCRMGGIIQILRLVPMALHPCHYAKPTEWHTSKREDRLAYTAISQHHMVFDSFVIKSNTRYPHEAAQDQVNA